MGCILRALRRRKHGLLIFNKSSELRRKSPIVFGVRVASATLPSTLAPI